MRERGMPMKGPLVLATLSDRKTQTRRIVKPQPDVALPGPIPGTGVCGKYTPDDARLGRIAQAIPCPYGVPGDRLWVREAWRACREADGIPPRDMTPAHRIWYEADQPALGLDGAGKYRPPMFMPRWACRLVLEVVSVRVERLKDISDDDAIAEGIDCDEDGLWRDYTPGSDEAYVFPVGSFWSLWDSINGEGAHNANPWVWVVEFKRVEAA